MTTAYSPDPDGAPVYCCRVSEITERRADDLSETELAQLAAVMSALQAEYAPLDPSISTATARAEFHPGTETALHRRLVATVDGTIVGMAGIFLDKYGANQHIAELTVEVHPDHRRRAIGSGLVGAAAAIARSEDRTSLVPWGLRSPTTEAFWKSLNLPEVQVDQTSRIIIDEIDADLMERWRADSSARAEGYRLHSWTAPCPEHLLKLYVDTQQGMNDAPLDDLDIAHEVVDEATTRDREERNARRNMKIRTIAAAAPDGASAAMTEVLLFDHRPWFVMQQGTTTLDAHRNRGLGRWLKAEMIAQLLANHPEAKVIETGNADSNAPMLKINTEMGFQPHRQLTTRQADLDDVERALAGRS